MDQAVTNIIIGAAISAVITILLTTVFGVAKTLIQLIKDVGILQDKVNGLLSLGTKVESIERMMWMRSRVSETRSVEAFLEPDPITSEEVALFEKSRRVGVRWMSDEEILGAIRALDREIDDDNITGEKRNAAIRLLVEYNGELEKRRSIHMATQKQEESPPMRTIETKKTVWDVIWPWRA